MATKAPGFFDNWKRRLDFLPFVSPKTFAFDPIELQRDVIRLRNYFHRSGFPKAKIDYPASQFRSADNSILVIMTIMEGAPLTMDSVRVQLQQPIYEGLLVRWNRLLSSIESRAGQRFTDLEQLSMENEIVSLLQDRGYAFASVLSEVSPGVNENTVVVAVKVDPGPLTTFDRILIEGSERLDERLLLRELRLSDAMNMDSPLYLSADAQVNYDKKERISGELQVDNIQMGSLTVESALAEFKGTLNRMTFDANMAIGGGSISASARLLNQSSFEIESGIVDQIDAFSIIAPGSVEVETNSSALNGTFSGVINLGSGAPQGSVYGTQQSPSPAGTGSFALTLLDSQLNRQKFNAQIDADFSGAAVDAKLLITTPLNGSIDGSLDWRRDTEKVAAALQFSHLDLLAWANIEGKSILNGTLTGNVNLLGDMPFVGSIALLEGSELNDLILESLAVDVSGTASDVNFGVSGSAQLNLVKGSAKASFFASENSANGDLWIQNADIAAMLGLNSASNLTASARIKASKSAENWDRFSIQVDSLNGRFEHLQLNQGMVDATLDPDGLQIDTLRLNGSFGHLTAQGYMPRHSKQPAANVTFNVAINSEVERLSQMKALGAGFESFQANGTLIGPAGGIRLNAEYQLTEAIFLPVEANNIKGRLLGELGEDWALSAAELVSELSLVELSPVVAEKAALSVSYDGSEVLASFQILFSEAREVNAQVSWFPSDVPTQLALVDFSANFDSDVWSMSGTPTIDLEKMVLTRPLLLSAGDQRIVAVSSTSADQVRNLITIHELRIDPFADLMAYPDLGGVLGGTLTATTQSGLSGASTGTYLQGSLSGSLSAYNQSAGNVNLQFLDNGRETQLNARLKGGEKESLQLLGSLPRLDSNDAVQIELTASAYSIDWIRSLLDPELVDDLKGHLDGQVRISGTPSEPYWSGKVRLENGQIGMPLLGKRKGMIVNSIQANFLFDGEVVTVESMLARSGDGRLRGSGTIDIKDLKLGEYNISLTAEDFKAIDSHDYFAVVSGQMSLGGTTDRPKLGGRIVVHRGDFWLTDATTADVFLPLALSDEDLATLQRRFGLRIAANDTTSFDAYDVLALEDFTVRMERDSWIRSKSNPKMDIQLTGDLDVRKKPKADPEVFGSISILPERSRIIQFGKRFELDRGELTFNGPMTAPNLNMEASYTIPSRGSETEEVTIRLIANGSPEDLEVTFDSDPSMELADIFSYIATGRPAAASLQISGAQSESYLESAAGLALGPVTDLIENLAGSGLGLDVIEIEHTGFSGLTLTAGKYVSPKLYVSVSQPISLSSSAEGNDLTNKNQTQVTIEYELVRQLLMNLVNRGTILRVNLRWQLAF